MKVGFAQIKSVVEAQPKSITRQYRSLIFPEHQVKKCHKLAFGTLFLSSTTILIATYLIMFYRGSLETDSIQRYKEAENPKYKRAWNYLYRNSKKGARMKMDSAWSKSG
jgi:hypothetical protein